MANPVGYNQWSDRPKSDFRMLMEAQGFNNDTLARASGISFTGVSRLSSGHTDPSHITLDTAIKLAKAMHMSLPAFVKALGL